MTSQSECLRALNSKQSILTGIQRGIEKEGLRVAYNNGSLSQRVHPKALGSALTHSQITTDYSEALLELVTTIHPDVHQLLKELKDIHAYVAQNIPDEIIWNQSMPGQLPAEHDIPVGWYGTSNSGMLKHVYRLGLAERYGKHMQCIAGIHYNFSVPDALWELLGTPGNNLQEQRSIGYLALIRNFMRYAWLLMYLFGASPAIDRSFLAGRPHQLQALNNNTLYLPYATSLRMSDIGYQNKAQSDLQLCYNDLDTFVARIYNAVTTPWPDYEAIGTHRDGKWIQLNTNILQIENEYYSSIRPKRVTERGERPATALVRRGVEYVEVRCLDVDPFTSTGISQDTACFLDAFLLFCAIEDSPDFPDGGFCRESHENFGTVVQRGREPGLILHNEEQPKTLQAWGAQILAGIEPYAEILDRAYGENIYQQALAQQQAKIENPTLTPSARVLKELQESGLGFQEYTLQQSQRHHKQLIHHALDATTQHEFKQSVKQSFIDKQALEDGDTESFDSYVKRFHEALDIRAYSDNQDL